MTRFLVSKTRQGLPPNDSLWSGHVERVLTGFVASFLSVPVALSQQNSASVYRSAYFLGRGDTGIATADNEDAIFYNPAGLAQGKGIFKRAVIASPQLEISQATKDLGRELANKNADVVDTVQKHVGRPNHAGVQNFSGLILRRVAFGAIVSSHADLLAYKDPKSGGLEAVKASADESAAVTFSLADRFFSDKIFVGATAKYFVSHGRGEINATTAEIEALKSKLEDRSSFIGSGQGGGADIGLMYHVGGPVNPAIGIVANDIGDTKITPTEDTSLDLDLKQTLNLGMSVEPGTRFSRLKLLLDYRDIMGKTETDSRKRIHIGGELSVGDWVGVTGGLNQGYPTAGFYMDLWLARLDLGLYTEETGTRAGTRPDTRYVVRLRMGF